MLDKVRCFYAKEYAATIQWLDSEFCTKKKDKALAINNAIQRCLAIAIFAQDLDVPFENIDSLYCEYNTKFNKLLEERGLK